MNVYLYELGKYVNLTENENIIIMEKANPIVDKKKNVVKDGIHIMMPDVVTWKYVQLQVRKKCLLELEKVLAPLNCVNTIEDIVDEAVIGKNNWMMYGSLKPDNIPYTVTYHWDMCCYDEPRIAKEEYVDLLSIRNKLDETKVLDGKIEEI